MYQTLEQINKDLGKLYKAMSLSHQEQDVRATIKLQSEIKVLKTLKQELKPN